METLPPGFFALAIAVVSALAGALLTWFVTQVTGGAGGESPPPSRQEEGMPTDDLLRVLRTKGAPAIFVQGRRVRHLREIRDRETGQETVLAVKAVLAFAEGWLPALGETEGSSVGPDRRGAVGSLGDTPSMSQETLATADRARDASPTEPLRLIEEIDGLIQRRLQERPDLDKHRIRLTRDVKGRPLIYVGREQYRSPDEIPNDDVSAFIQETIRIWEAQ